ncbi:hypothetical protein PAXRUDRAFT_19753 [Paxillus rubicundulus Ve08.2h10]|uniref:Uncharacterized protein n=1 Tax=Paxillus rubicundulus Ve08.2h10 TaxID=930991 RepID=A0A0D0CU15_9AGAM|nr:hypothetical protein PAXRUDRAFT_19753 [Paxillus rubicundulus Ve08.2h10]
MDNAMHAMCIVIQHADVIPGILIAVEQLLHPEAAVWPNWMGMIQWSQESVAHHPWAQQGTIVRMEYEFGDSSSNDNEVSQPSKEPMGAEEKEADRMTTTKKATRPKQMTKAQQAAERRDNVQSEDEGPLAMWRMMATPTPAPQSTPLRTPIPVPNPAQQRQGHRGRRRGAPQPLAAPQPVNACSTCIDFGVLCEPNPGYSCFTCRSRKKKCKQSGMTRGRSALRAHQLTQSRSADALLQRGTPTRSRAPSEAPATRSRRPLRATSSTRDTHQHRGTRKSPRLSQHSIQQYGDHAAHPAFASHS